MRLLAFVTASALNGKQFDTDSAYAISLPPIVTSRESGAVGLTYQYAFRALAKRVTNFFLFLTDCALELNNEWYH